jgi:PAS domain S-box-containing protein
MKKQNQLYKGNLVAEMIANKADNSIIVANRKGEIEWVNEGFIRLTGYKLSDVRGSKAEILRLGAKTGLSDQALLEDCISNRTSRTYEVVNFSKEGKEYWVSTTITPCFDETTDAFQSFLVIESDITERMKMELDLRYSKGLAEEARQAQEMFLANMSHEIRTPMNAILGFTELLQKSDLNAEQRDFVETILHSGENLLVLINDILDFSRISSGKITFDSKEFNVSDIINSVIKTLSVKATETDNKIIFDPILTDVNVVGDPTRFKQILINLVNNALKFTSKGEVSIITDVTTGEEGPVIEVSVKDSGIGIGDEKLEFIFDRFNQASDYSIYGGTGLGLPIVKSLVELQGGKIEVASTVDVGSTFTFSIPFKQGSGEGLDTKEKDISQVWIDKKVLLVEDNLINQKFAKRLLSDYGLKVTIAANGEEALMACRSQQFELILMDIQMPIMDGYEATRLIRETIDWGATVPIIAMTAHATDGIYQACQTAGADNYISKPVRSNKLIGMIMEYCDWDMNGMNQKGLTRRKGITDLSLIMDSAGGDHEYIVDILRSLIKEVEIFEADMETFLAAEDWNQVSGIAHKMQSAAQLMGTTQVVEQLAKIQGFAKDPFNQKNIRPLVNEIESSFRYAVKELEASIFDQEKLLLQKSVN